MLCPVVQAVQRCSSTHTFTHNILIVAHSFSVQAYFERSTDGPKPPPRHHTLIERLANNNTFAPVVISWATGQVPCLIGDQKRPRAPRGRCHAATGRLVLSVSCTGPSNLCSEINIKILWSKKSRNRSRGVGSSTPTGRCGPASLDGLKLWWWYRASFFTVGIMDTQVCDSPKHILKHNKQNLRTTPTAVLQRSMGPSFS